MSAIVFNEVKEDIVGEKHICYYTVDTYNTIRLMEVIEKTIKHPEARDLAYITKFETRSIKEYKRIDANAAASILLEAAQNNIDAKQKQVKT